MALRTRPECNLAAGARPVVVAIPARNEAVLLPACLAALAAQQGAPAFAVLVYANDCTDTTAAIARARIGCVPYRLEVREVALPPDQRNAGAARRLAMAAACGLAGDDPAALLLSTDADAQPRADWIARMVGHVAAGADAVAGRAVIGAAESATLDPRVRLRSRREAHLARLMDRLASLVDPVAWDPWPRHAGHWGANFGVTLAAYCRSGGVPPVHVAEDRAMFAALDSVDARIRHAADSVVAVSARLEGRAAGGMADVLARRSRAPDPQCDAALEPLSHALRRWRLRAALRADPAGFGTARNAGRLGLSPARLRALILDRAHGAAWAALSAHAPALRERRLPYARLQPQTLRATGLLLRLAPDAAAPPPLDEDTLV